MPFYSSPEFSDKSGDLICDGHDRRRPRSNDLTPGSNGLSARSNGIAPRSNDLSGRSDDLYDLCLFNQRSYDIIIIRPQAIVSTVAGWSNDLLRSHDVIGITGRSYDRLLGVLWRAYVLFDEWGNGGHDVKQQTNFYANKGRSSHLEKKAKCSLTRMHRLAAKVNSKIKSLAI